MSRYIAGYFEGFSHHYPFIHVPTFSVCNYKDVPEFILAMMAVGAQFRYEHAGGLALYRAARTIIFYRQEQKDIAQPSLHSTSTVLQSENYSPYDKPSLEANSLGAVLFLAMFASWQLDKRLVQESIQYQYLLVQLIRKCGLSESEVDDGRDWQIWARKEITRRIKLATFCFLNLQSLAYNTAPVLLSNELHLRLPTSCKEWIATDPKQWIAARTAAPPSHNFQDAIGRLLQLAGSAPVFTTSPFGNYVLIHGLLQRITVSRQLAFGPSVGTQPLQDAASLQESLLRWKDAWQRAPESVLDFRDPKDSLSWTSISLVGLAHLRLYFDMGFHRLLHSCDAEEIANAAYKCHSPGRGSHLTQALVHSAHLLNIPVQLGVSYLSSCQAYSWSIQHCLCFFECTIFLSKWIWAIADGTPSDFTGELLRRASLCVGFS
jgi:hypothetical protein